MTTALFVVALVGACRCDDGPAPIRKAEQRHRALGSEGVIPKLPEPEGTPIDASALAGTLPASLGEATADGEAVADNTPLANDGKLPIARRTYEKGDLRITLQLSDTLHAPLLRAAVADAQAKAEEQGERSGWRGGAVQGHDVAVQYLASQSVAIANVVVTDRIFLNVRVDPADSAEAAIEWARKLPLEPITKLQPPGSEPAPPSQPPPM